MSIDKNMQYKAARAEDLVILKMILDRQAELGRLILRNKDNKKTNDNLLSHNAMSEIIAIVQHRLDFNEAMAAEEEENRVDNEGR